MSGNGRLQDRVGIVDHGLRDPDKLRSDYVVAFNEFMNADPNLEREILSGRADLPQRIEKSAQLAEKLSLAAMQTAIQLVLRNPLDREVAKTPGTALSHLFLGGKYTMPKGPSTASSDSPVTQRPVRRAAPAPAAPPVALPPPPKKETPFVMEIISGPSKTEKKFENGEGK